MIGLYLIQEVDTVSETYQGSWVTRENFYDGLCRLAFFVSTTKYENETGTGLYRALFFSFLARTNIFFRYFFFILLARNGLDRTEEVLEVFV